MLRRDHLAGGFILVAALGVLAISGDLPFGTLASPGAGMLPKLVIGLMAAFGIVLIATAGSSPRLTSLDWADVPHAARVLAIIFVAVAAFTWLGFLLTMPLLLFALTFGVERRPLVPSLAFSIIVPLATYLLFEYVLSTPLERGQILGM